MATIGEITGTKRCAHLDRCTNPFGPLLPATRDFFLFRGGKLTDECKWCFNARLSREAQFEMDGFVPGFKRCGKGEKCLTPGGPILPATSEYFAKKSAGSFGLDGWCRKCKYAHHKAYRQANKEKTREAERISSNESTQESSDPLLTWAKGEGIHCEVVKKAKSKPLLPYDPALSDDDYLL